jgi:hypothetical protein
MTIEEKLAKSLVDDAKGRVNEEIRTLKTADKPSQKVGLDVIDDEKIKKLVEFRKSIPQENLPLYKRELEKANARLSYLDYLRYTDSQFIPTKFHRLLAQIIQDTVEKVEKGESVYAFVYQSRRDTERHICWRKRYLLGLSVAILIQWRY